MHHLICIMSVLLNIAMSYCILRIGLYIYIYIYMKFDAYGPLPTVASIYYIPDPTVCPTICTPFYPISRGSPSTFATHPICAAFLCHYLPRPSATIVLALMASPSHPVPLAVIADGKFYNCLLASCT